MTCRLEDVLKFGSIGMCIQISAFSNDRQFTAVSLLRIVSCLTQDTLMWEAIFINPSMGTLAMKSKLIGITVFFLDIGHHLVF
jgi:hypothetical protein